jgi:hypothetical protein
LRGVGAESSSLINYWLTQATIHLREMFSARQTGVESSLDRNGWQKRLTHAVRFNEALLPKTKTIPSLLKVPPD